MIHCISQQWCFYFMSAPDLHMAQNIPRKHELSQQIVTFLLDTHVARWGVFSGYWVLHLYVKCSLPAGCFVSVIITCYYYISEYTWYIASPPPSRLQLHKYLDLYWYTPTLATQLVIFSFKHSSCLSGIICRKLIWYFKCFQVEINREKKEVINLHIWGLI